MSVISMKEIKDPLAVLGISVGLFLVVLAGLFSLSSVLGPFDQRLIMCAGLGVILGAFGATMTINYKGATITGVAGTMVVGFLLISDQSKEVFTRGVITGEVRGALIEIRGGTPILGAFAGSGREYEFVIEGPELQRPSLQLYINFDCLANSADCEREEIYCEVLAKHVNPHLGTGKTMAWSFERRGRRLLDSATSNDLCQGDTTTFSERAHSPEESGWSLLPQAWAQTQRPIPELLAELSSASPIVRRQAREEIAERGPAVLGALGSALRVRREDSYLLLGALSAIAGMLRGPEEIDAVRKALGDEDIAHIVLCLANENKDVRVAAGQVLVTLKDPRVGKAAAQLAQEVSTSDNGKYNALLLIKETLPALSDGDAVMIGDQLKSGSWSGPRTSDLAREIAERADARAPNQ